MKKKYLISCIIFLLISCSGNEKALQKPITGIDPEWNEELGYYNVYPSVIEVDDTTRYVYYTRNEKKFSLDSDSIAVRKATLVQGKWQYDDFKTVLRLPKNEEAWDGKYISSPSVVKGKFTYNDEQYQYLMAYSGSTMTDRYNGKIGLAVAKSPEDEFIRVGDHPLLQYDMSEYSASGIQKYKGLQEPSLVSYDKKGKVQLFYSHYGNYNMNYCIEMDCSSLNDIQKGGRMLLDVTGLEDDRVNTTIYSGDFAFDPIHNEYIACKNYSSTTSGLPSVSEAVQIIYAPASVLTEVDYSRNEEQGGIKQYWKLINEKYRKIGAVKTADDYSDDEKKWSGYYRVYNGCVVKDEYGWIEKTDVIEIYFTSSALNNSPYLKDDEYLYSPMIHSYKVEFNNR